MNYVNHYTVKDLDLTPRRQSDGRGFDLFAAHEVILPPLSVRAIDTGVKTAFKSDLRPTSGNGYKFKITLINTPATVEASYTKNIMVLMINLSFKFVLIEKYAKIAQMLLVPDEDADIIYMSPDNFEAKCIQAGLNREGLGSTDKKYSICHLTLMQYVKRRVQAWLSKRQKRLSL